MEEGEGGWETGKIQNNEGKQIIRYCKLEWEGDQKINNNKFDIKIKLENKTKRKEERMREWDK